LGRLGFARIIAAAKTVTGKCARAEISQFASVVGLILLGFTSLYREGLKVVLFLQSYNLRLGGGRGTKGALLAMMLAAMVAVADFCSPTSGCRTAKC